MTRRAGNTMRDPGICPTCGHRPHQPLGCKARYHGTFMESDPGEPCLCENWRALPRSNAEESLATLLRWEKLPEPEREYRFDSSRRWRFDFAWPSLLVAVEVEGGSWINGRHNRGSSFEAELEKYNAATIQSWWVLRVTPGMIEDGRAVELIKRALL